MDKVEAIFNQALAAEQIDERRKIVQEACGTDTALLAKVERYLRLHESAEQSFPSEPREQSCAMPLGESPGAMIGRYKLQVQIGEGGFGAVFLAEQEEPVRRKVALKIIKAGMDTKQVIARFEAERQALAMMDHPNIAKVLDAGATEQGRPYFVMELVQGIPITKFCDQDRLSIRERLDLFISVCHAIQHAHQKGIIHRDIKPSNVLVTMDHGKPHPMVIDFGVAKAIDQRLTEKTLFTNFGHMIGTPAYMSPEQAEMSRTDVDTRSDVYALGILLYELLTGTTPFPEERFKEVGYAEWQRIIREEDPLRPSTVFSRLNGKSRGIANNRQSESAVLLKLLQGDLDWIVLKAIEKGRDRRYATPLELVNDLQHYLANEPVTARPPSAFYKLNKFARRNRAAVIASAAVIIAIVAGIWATAWQAIRATRSERQAQIERANAEAALRFVQQDLLMQIDPSMSTPGSSLNRDIKLRTAITLAAQGIEERYGNEPLVEAAIRLTIGNAFRVLGELEAAEPHIRRSLTLRAGLLGPNHSETLESQLGLAWLIYNQSKYKEAELLCQHVLDQYRSMYGPDHRLTLQAMLCQGYISLWSAQYQRAEALFNEVRFQAERASLTDQNIIHNAMGGLAWMAFVQGRRQDWVRLCEETLESARNNLGPDHPFTLHEAVFVAQNLRFIQKRFWESDQLAQDTYERCLRVLGEGHITSVFVLGELAYLQRHRGLQILPFQREVLRLGRLHLGPEARHTLFEQYRFGESLLELGYLDEAKALLTEARNVLHQSQGSDALFGRQILQLMGSVALVEGRWQDAENFFLQEIEACQRVLGGEAPETENRIINFANFLTRQGKWAEAISLYQDHLAYLEGNTRKLTAALLIAQLAGDETGIISFAAKASESLADGSDPKERRHLALACLLLPHSHPVVRASLPQIEQVMLSEVEPLDRRLVEGLIAYHQGNWENAQARLSRFDRYRSGWRTTVAKFYGAMAMHQQGRTAEARTVFDDAQVRLERMLRTGDLGRSRIYLGFEWADHVAPILAHHVAATLIEPGSSSLVIDDQYLASARAQWIPVRDFLAQGNHLAVQRDWLAARDQFLQAIRHPYFTWEAAIIQEPKLREKVAALNALTESWPAYDAVIESLLHSEWDDSVGTINPLLLTQERISSESKELALSLATRIWQRSQREDAPMEWQRWNQLFLGMAHYRVGHFDQAVNALSEAQHAYHLNCSGTAFAFAAMAAHHLGDAIKAAQCLSDAEAAWKTLYEESPEGLNEDWCGAVILEIAIKEAKQIMASSKENF